ncbi:ABC transporter ATP-binding protein [Halalkaliarchaeum sp. AArc-GB]|uniref:energy-coupling factor ABC transporter ATP-binding protein n=1 Tax=Halalkaliarchaeum sp. AArc-GB TaxID=3074078 RepID=UPI002861169A|nr:ABC transporter ATP-binding protein [Halalkaliarchaeum sp. AArc-GB]MDR5673753.1 ABC transporter ATP-binding protein [Halalkaliarchaeum sp. AArc-GB]
MTIEARGLEFAYETAPILEGVDFRAAGGEVTVLLGRNGAGKSTLLRQFNGLLEPDSGAVYVDGDRVSYDRGSLRSLRRRVGYLFQNPEDQLVAPTVGGDVAFGPENLGVDPSDRVESALETLGLEGYEDRLCNQLSGGEKKRASLAGVLAMEPDYLLLDEPTLGLDGDGCARLSEDIQRIREADITVVIATHDLGFALSVGDSFAVLEDGVIAHRGASISREQAVEFGLRTFVFEDR